MARTRPLVTPWRASTVDLIGACLASDSRLPLSGIWDQRISERAVPLMQPLGGTASFKIMRHKLLNADPPITYAVVLETGDEVVAALGAFIREQEVETASMTAIGAFSSAILGYFDWETKNYKQIPVNEQVEVLSLIGDVAVSGGEPSLHVHAVLGKSDGTTVGGHLLEAQVRPTLEVILIQPPSYLRKRRDPESGLALIAIDPV